MDIREVHLSLVNGQRKQAVQQIDENFIHYDFWEDYLNYLKNTYVEESAVLKYFSDMTISYFRIKNK